MADYEKRMMIYNGTSGPKSNLNTPIHITPEWNASVIGIQFHRNILPDCVEAP
jgi:hypothetical protein